MDRLAAEVNQGTFHESLNLAAIWTLPVVYVIENNLYTEYSDYRRMTGIERLSDRPASYGRLAGSRRT